MSLTSVAGIFRDTNWAITLLFMISGRTITASAMPPAPTSAGFKPHYPMLVSSMFRRAFRFALPVIIVALMQWQLCAHGSTQHAAEATQTVFIGASAMTTGPAGWCGIGNFRGLIVYLVNLFTFNAPVQAQRFGSMLWTTTWFMWGSYAVYLTAFLTAQLASNRYVIFATLLGFSWATFSWNWVFILGYMLHDLSVHAHLRRPRSNILAIALQIVSISLAFILVWVRPIRNGIDTAGRALQIEEGAGNELISAANSFSVFFLLLFLELSPGVSKFLGRNVFKHLGHLAAGVYLLHPAFLYTLIPRLALSRRGEPLSQIVGICWVALAALSLLSAFFFYQLVERQSVLLGMYAWRYLVKPVDDGTVPGDKLKGDRYVVMSEKRSGKSGEPPVVETISVGPDMARSA
ncbi:hypothetical protein HKX48_003753 [Thoreauomyces humboldtii]|nr:hypothetical protein HKX48_003753 [Thoreauomyces humboldtii]